MPKFLVLHNYEPVEEPKVIGFLASLKEKAETGGLRAGIRLLEFNSCIGQKMNYAVWEAPNKNALETALRQMDPLEKGPSTN